MISLILPLNMTNNLLYPQQMSNVPNSPSYTSYKLDICNSCLCHWEWCESFVDLLLLVSSILAPNRPPGNVSWKTVGSSVTVRWDHVKSMDNESAVLGYKVSDTHCHPTLRLSFRMCVCVGSSVSICMSSEYLFRFSHFSQRLLSYHFIALR